MRKIEIEPLRQEFQKICEEVVGMQKTKANEVLTYNKVSDLFQKHNLQDIEFEIVFTENTAEIVPNRPIDELAIAAILKV